MKKKLFVFICLVYSITASSQSVIFLHHSVGGAVYSEGNVAAWISNYNTAHGTNYQITERAFPDTPYDWANYPYDYWNIWINNQCSSTNPNIQCIANLVQNYDVIIFKHCFPGADILADDGNPSVSSSVKTIANYKLQYRALRTMMDLYPQKKFIVWTLTPEHRLATNPDNAARARQFVDWVKGSWLTEDGKSHPNIYIFDFFGLIAELNQNPTNGEVNCLKYNYEKSHTDFDAHPNTLANQTVGPIFGQFIVNAIQNVTSVIDVLNGRPSVSIYPNPASGKVTIDFSLLDKQATSIEIYNLQGKILLHRSVVGEHKSIINTAGFSPGTYLIRIKSEGPELFERFAVLKN